jgi:hypothetical protein
MGLEQQAAAPNKFMMQQRRHQDYAIDLNLWENQG